MNNGMTLKEMKTFLNNLPENFDDYIVVNGEVGTLPENDNDGQEQVMYRVDSPIVTLYVNQETKEVCFFTKTTEDITKLMEDANKTENGNP